VARKSQSKDCGRFVKSAWILLLTASCLYLLRLLENQDNKVKRDRDMTT